jgi:tRNA U34 5-methylaminomethyl-2-thiouridine-forming methyltransferase MnmC
MKGWNVWHASEQKVTLSHGNEYTLETLDNGVLSFRHRGTGEILHGSVGPEREARQLYIEASGLLHWNQSTVTVFDVGTGCGAQLLALLDFLAHSEHCTDIEVYSFDLEKQGLSAALAARDHFPSVQRHASFLERTLKDNDVEWQTAEGRTLRWHFLQGDFRTTIRELHQTRPELRADFIFYDFFSPASHPWLWTFELFSDVFKFSAAHSRLVTYSSATCVKAALAAAGWFVGQTISSGKKSRSILAAGSLEYVNEPLTDKFLSTFSLSHKPFCDAETDESKAAIALRLKSHAQFRAEQQFKKS